ncbi:hypothetical protein DMENIID0001_153720 [Sergentomyia squamirostris]
MGMCSVPGCDGIDPQPRHRLLLFHSLPQNADLAMKWLRILDIYNWNSDIKICGLHFDPSSYTKVKGSLYLMKNAMPIPASVGGLEALREILVESNNELQNGEDNKDITSESIKRHADETENSQESKKHMICDGANFNCNLEMSSDCHVSKGKRFQTTEQNSFTQNNVSSLHQPFELKVSEDRDPLSNFEEESTMSSSSEDMSNKVSSTVGDILKLLLEKNLISVSCLRKLNSIPGVHEPVVNQELCTRKRHNYTSALRKFCLNLNHYSPEAFNYVREELGFSALPETDQIATWYMSTNYRPGFSTEAFEATKQAQVCASEQLYVHLSFGDISVLEKIDWVKRESWGFVTFGDDDIDEDVASQILVLMAVCINAEWKIPLGYFPYRIMSADQKSNMIKLCLTLLLETGIKVIGVTCDPTSVNVSAFEDLGCEWNYPSFNTMFSYNGEDLAFHPNPKDVVRLVKCALRAAGHLIDSQGNTIDWVFLERLIELQEQDSYNCLDTKTLRAQAYFSRQKLKIRLAVDELNGSVGDVLEFCDQVLRLPQFENSSGTANFIRIFSSILDILNSMESLCVEDLDKLETFITSAEQYISSLKYLHNEEIVINSMRSRGFIGTIVSLKNLIFFYIYLINHGGLRHVITQKLTTDNLEMFLAACRSNSDSRSIPTVREFAKCFKKFIQKCQSSDRGVAHFMPLDDIIFLHTSQRNAIDIINLSVGSRIPHDLSINKKILDNYDYLFDVSSKTSEYRSQVLQYLGGYMAKTLQMEIKCQDCYAILEGSFTLLWSRDLGFFKSPPQSILKICQQSERFFKQSLDRTENCIGKIIKLVQYEVSNSSKMFAMTPLHNVRHCLLLINAICTRYLTIRLYYENKKSKKMYRIMQQVKHVMLLDAN